MKKALQISIAGTLFTIEEDAYAALEKYLSSIRAHFDSTPGSADIISDIESRIAEQFQEIGTRIVTLTDVETVMATMGTVADFGSTADTKDSTSSAPKESKKLYRDLDRKIVAGVCAGMASYIGIDPLWVRIVFALITILTHGFGIIIYIILALAIPAARTASQKLEMEGTPVTLDTISKNVKEKAAEISEKHGSRFMRILSAPFVALKWVVDFLVRCVGPIVRMAIGITLATLSIFGMIALTFLAPVVLLNGSTYVGFPIGQVVSPALFYAAITLAYAALLIPLIVIFMLSLSLIRRTIMLRSGLALTLLFVWCAVVAGAGVAGVNMGERIHADPTVRAIYHEQTIEYPLAAGISSLSVSDGMRVTYVQGPVPSVSIRGEKRALEAFAATTSGSLLSLSRIPLMETRCIFCESHLAGVTITLPSLDSVTLTDGADFYADKWSSPGSISLDASDSSYSYVEVDAAHLVITARQGSTVKVSGKAGTTSFIENSGGRIETEDLDI